MRFSRMRDFSTEYWCSNEDIGDNFRNDDRYVPVIWDPKDPWQRPRYQKLQSDRCNTCGDADGERDSGSSGGDEGSDSSEERNKDKKSDAGSISSEQEQDVEATKVWRCAAEFSFYMLWIGRAAFCNRLDFASIQDQG
jgi:hypothetical protein